jgi:hypothetical protein
MIALAGGQACWQQIFAINFKTGSTFKAIKSY